MNDVLHAPAPHRLNDPFRQLVQGFEDAAMILLDLDGNIESWNAGAQRINQYTAAEIVGKHFSILYNTGAWEAEEPAHDLASALRNGQHDMNGWRTRKNGTIYRARVHLALLKDTHGSPAGFSSTTHDLTEARLVEEQSEERLRMMIEGVEDYAILMLDESGNIRSWNSGAARIKQYEAHEIVGRNFSVFYLPVEAAAGAPERHLEIAARVGKFEEEGWRTRKDGSVFWANVIITALGDKSGALVGFSKVTRDLTERKAAQEALQRSRALFAGIVSISEDAIISTGEDRRITLFNGGAEKIFGYTNAEIVGRKIDLLIPSRFSLVHDGYFENFSSSPDALRTMNERGSIFGLRKDGTEFPAAASISKFEIGGEKVLTVRLRDITEQKRAEAAILRSEARFAGIVRISEDAIISVDDDRNITLFNEGAQAIFGYASDEVMGKRIEMLIPGRLAPDVLIAINERGAISGLRKNGKEFPAEASVSRFEVAGERVLTIRLRDITERRKAEARISNSLAEKEILLKEIHHRVKNNLQVISSLLSLQSGDPRVESVKELFIESQNRVTSMALIHEKLYQSADFANIDFADYIESLAGNLFRSYGVNPEQITLTIEVDVELDIDRAIPCGLILNELLSNSLKYAFPNHRKGAVLLRFHQHEGRFVLLFADDGVGLRPGFDFRQTESLGFQLVTTLTSQIGGEIERLLPGKHAASGTAFEITFAVALPSEAKSAMAN
jgi:PAS domain S-box-containing protein